MSSTPASSETSTDFLSSVLHAVVDYSKTLIENTLFIHELDILKENAFLAVKIILWFINYFQLASWFTHIKYPSIIETTFLCGCLKITAPRLYFLLRLSIGQPENFHSCHAVSLRLILLYPLLNLSLWIWLWSWINRVKSQKDHKTQHQIPESKQNIRVLIQNYLYSTHYSSFGSQRKPQLLPDV